MSRLKDLTGMLFGMLEVISRAENQPITKRSRWNCKCECGNEVNVLGDLLRDGFKTHCGCKRKETGRYQRKYEDKDTTKMPEYKIWVQMKSRCGRHPRYKDIKVDERWMNSFMCFIEDMGKRPSDKHSIDRINPFGNYEPLNCRWATIDIQNNNKKANYNIDGSTIIKQKTIEPKKPKKQIVKQNPDSPYRTIIINQELRNKYNLSPVEIK